MTNQVAMRPIGDHGVGCQILLDEVLETSQIETERVIGRKDRELGAVGAGELEAVVGFRR